MTSFTGCRSAKNEASRTLQEPIATPPTAVAWAELSNEVGPGLGSSIPVCFPPDGRAIALKREKEERLRLLDEQLDDPLPAEFVAAAFEDLWAEGAVWIVKTGGGLAGKDDARPLLVIAPLVNRLLIVKAADGEPGESIGERMSTDPALVSRFECVQSDGATTAPVRPDDGRSTLDLTSRLYALLEKRDRSMEVCLNLNLASTDPESKPSSIKLRRRYLFHPLLQRWVSERENQQLEKDFMQMKRSKE